MSTTTRVKRQKEEVNGSGQIIHYGDICIARYWYEESRFLNYDSLNCVYKFMAIWLAFNFLYAEYNSINPNKNCQSEREAIENYCTKRKAIIEKADIFNNFSGEVAVLTEKPVTSLNKISSSSKRTNGNDKDWSLINQNGATDINSDDFARFQSLIQIIYTVRCNLFHGAKNPANERDYNLVYASARIIEFLVGELIKTE